MTLLGRGMLFPDRWAIDNDHEDDPEPTRGPRFEHERRDGWAIVSDPRNLPASDSTSEVLSPTDSTRQPR